MELESFFIQRVWGSFGLPRRNPFNINLTYGAFF